MCVHVCVRVVRGGRVNMWTAHSRYLGAHSCGRKLHASREIHAVDAKTTMTTTTTLTIQSRCAPPVCPCNALAGRSMRSPTHASAHQRSSAKTTRACVRAFVLILPCRIICRTINTKCTNPDTWAREQRCRRTPRVWALRTRFGSRMS